MSTTRIYFRGQRIPQYVVDAWNFRWHELGCKCGAARWELCSDPHAFVEQDDGKVVWVPRKGGGRHTR